MLVTPRKVITITTIYTILHLARLMEARPPSQLSGKFTLQDAPNILSREFYKSGRLGQISDLAMLRTRADAKRYGAEGIHSTLTPDLRISTTKGNNKFVRFDDDDELSPSPEISSSGILKVIPMQSTNHRSFESPTIGSDIQNGPIQNSEPIRVQKIKWIDTKRSPLNVLKTISAPRKIGNPYSLLHERQNDFSDGYIPVKQIEELEMIEDNKKSGRLTETRKKRVSLFKIPFTFGVQMIHFLVKFAKEGNNLVPKSDLTGFDSNDQRLWSNEIGKSSQKVESKYFTLEKSDVHSKIGKKDNSDGSIIRNSLKGRNKSLGDLSSARGSPDNNWSPSVEKISPSKHPYETSNSAYLEYTSYPESYKAFKDSEARFRKSKNPELMGSNEPSLEKNDNMNHRKTLSPYQLRKLKNTIRNLTMDDAFKRNRLIDFETPNLDASTRYHKIVKKDLSTLRDDDDDSAESEEEDNDSSEQNHMIIPNRKIPDSDDSDENSSKSEESSHSSEEKDFSAEDKLSKSDSTPSTTDDGSSNNVRLNEHPILFGDNAHLSSEASNDVKIVHRNCDDIAWKPLSNADAFKRMNSK